MPLAVGEVVGPPWNVPEPDWGSGLVGQTLASHAATCHQRRRIKRNVILTLLLCPLPVNCAGFLFASYNIIIIIIINNNDDENDNDNDDDNDDDDDNDYYKYTKLILH